jgi:hypothetical protein
MAITIGSLMRGVPEKTRALVMAAYRQRGGTFSGAFDRAQKVNLCEAIFEIEAEMEHALSHLAPTHPRLRPVRLLNERRNRILDDIGENENQHRPPLPRRAPELRARGNGLSVSESPL